MDHCGPASLPAACRRGRCWTPRLTLVSEGKPFRRLLIVSKKMAGRRGCVAWGTSFLGEVTQCDDTTTGNQVRFRSRIIFVAHPPGSRNRSRSFASVRSNHKPPSRTAQRTLALDSDQHKGKSADEKRDKGGLDSGGHALGEVRKNMSDPRRRTVCHPVGVGRWEVYITEPAAHNRTTLQKWAQTYRIQNWRADHIAMASAYPRQF